MSTFMQFRKDHEYMDDQSSTINDYFAEHQKQPALPKPVSVKDEDKLLLRRSGLSRHGFSKQKMRKLLAR